MKNMRRFFVLVLALTMCLAMASVANATWANAILENTRANWVGSYTCPTCGSKLVVGAESTDPTTTNHAKTWHCVNSSCADYNPSTGHSYYCYTINARHVWDSAGNCTVCLAYNSSYASCSHSSYSYSYEYYSSSYHYYVKTCRSCGETISSSLQSHTTSTSYSQYSSSQHRVTKTCSDCGETISSSLQSHTTSTSYSQYSSTQHKVSQSCSVCGYSTTSYASHTDSNSDGKCDSCGYSLSVTVTWNAGTNGGTVNGSSSVTTSVTSGSTATAPSYTPVKTGYSFKGWYTSSSGGSLYSTVTVSAARTFYAQFTAKSYTVTWNTGSGMTTTNQTYGSTLTLPTTPSKDGFTFKGWYTAASSGTQVTSSTVYNTAAATTYYAQFTANSYTVTWNTGSGTTTTSQTYGSTLTLPSTPSKDGYTFKGWYTSASGGTQVTRSTVYNTAAATTYYAHWEQDTVFSVTVPATLPIIMAEDGSIHTTAAAILNNSTAAVKVTGVTVQAQNGWSLAPYATNMARAKVDSKQVGFALNGAQTNGSGNSQALALSGNWSIDQGGWLALNYDAVVSALSESVTNESILSIVFTVAWA